MLKLEWFILLALYKINSLLKKVKKSVDSFLLRWYSNTCPWDRDKTSVKTFEKSFWQDEVEMIKYYLLQKKKVNEKTFDKSCWQRKTALIE